jgi:hypothetical protein
MFARSAETTPRLLRTRHALRVAAAAAVLAAALVAGVPVSSADTSDTQALTLNQKIGPGHRLRLVVSSLGASATEYRKGRPVAGAIVNYRTHVLYLTNFDDRTYTQEPISKAAAQVKRDNALIRKARTEITFETASGRPEFLPPTVKRTDRRSTIAGIDAQAYLVRQNGVMQRLWFGLKVPVPPAAIQRQVRGVVDVPAQAGGVMLRAEVLTGKKWRVGLDTTESRVVTRAAGAFAPPSGWKRVGLQSRELATVPAIVSRLFGPVSTRPDVFTLYWGGTFSPSFRVSMNTFLSSLVGGPAPSAYWAPLAQYGVSRGAFIGSATTAYPLAPTVGSWNFLAISAMVTNAYFTTAAPKIWWRFGDRDPVISIFVPANLVAAGGWSGYHLFAPSPAWLLPWPVSMAAHPFMPWLITKAPLLGGAPSVGLTTVAATHELVETVSDPTPLSANVDFAKSPPWVGGEIADICSVGVSFVTTRFGFTVQNYWSNVTRTCVG